MSPSLRRLRGSFLKTGPDLNIAEEIKFVIWDWFHAAKSRSPSYHTATKM